MFVEVGLLIQASINWELQDETRVGWQDQISSTVTSVAVEPVIITMRYKGKGREGKNINVNKYLCV